MIAKLEWTYSNVQQNRSNNQQHITNNRTTALKRPAEVQKYSARMEAF